MNSPKRSLAIASTPRQRWGIFLILSALLGLLGIGLAPSTAGATGDHNYEKKVFVCKYVGTPGVDERLQTGQNPISVSVNAVSGATPGSYFNDAQGRSYVLSYDDGGPEPDPSECPKPYHEPKPEWTVDCATITNTGDVVFYVRYLSDGNTVPVQPGSSFEVPLDEFDLDAALVIDGEGEQVGSFVPKDCTDPIEPTVNLTVNAVPACSTTITGTISFDGDPNAVAFVKLFHSTNGGDATEMVLDASASVPGSVNFTITGYAPADVVALTASVSFIIDGEGMEYLDFGSVTIPQSCELPKDATGDFTVTGVCGVNNDTVTLTGVAHATASAPTWANGKVSVTFTADPGHLSTNGEKTWVVTKDEVNTAACPTTTTTPPNTSTTVVRVPSTGGTDGDVGGKAALFAVLVGALVGGLTLLGRRRGAQVS